MSRAQGLPRGNPLAHQGRASQGVGLHRTGEIVDLDILSRALGVGITQGWGLQPTDQYSSSSRHQGCREAAAAPQ